jgi:hypothetical protein
MRGLDPRIHLEKFVSMIDARVTPTAVRFKFDGQGAWR